MSSRVTIAKICCACSLPKWDSLILVINRHLETTAVLDDNTTTLGRSKDSEQVFLEQFNILQSLTLEVI